MTTSQGSIIGYRDYIGVSAKPRATSVLWSSTDILEALDKFAHDVQGTIALSNSDAQESTTIAPGISIVVQSLAPGELSPFHRHSFWHLYIVRSGSGLATTDVEGESRELNSGDILFIPAWTSHAVSNPSGDKPLVLIRLQNLPQMASVGALAREIGSAPKLIYAEDR